MTTASRWVAGLTLLLYLPGFWWGAPHATGGDRVTSWATDDETPLGPLAEVANILEPKADRNLGYPLFHYFLVAGAYAPYLGYVWLSGGFEVAGDEFPFGLRDPVRVLRMLTYLSHLVSVFMSVGLALVVYHTTRMLFDTAAARCATAIVMTAVPVVYYGRIGNLEATLTFLLAATTWVYARILKEGSSPRRVLLLGSLAGLALATKEPAAAYLLGVGVPWAWGVVGDARGGRTPLPQAIRQIAICGAAAVAALALGSGLAVEPSRWWAHIESIRETLARARSGQVLFVEAYPRTLAGFGDFAWSVAEKTAASMTLPALLLAVAGAGLLLRAAPRSGLLLFPLVTYPAALYAGAGIVQFRYLLPLLPLLGILAGAAMMAAVRSRPALRWAGFTLLVATLGLGLLRAVDFISAMLNDSRYAAGEFLARELPAGARLGFFGPDQKLPPVAADVELVRLTPFLGGMRSYPSDAAAANRILADLRRDGPEAIVLIPDFSPSRVVPANVSCPPGVFEALESGRTDYERRRLFLGRRLFPWVGTTELDYPDVNPPIRLYVRKP